MGKLIEILDDNKKKLTVKSQDVFIKLYEQFKVYNTEIATYDKQIELIANQDMKCKEIMKIDSIGPLTACKPPIITSF